MVKTRKTRKTRGGGLDENIANAKYDVKVVLFTKKDVSEDFKYDILAKLIDKYENVEIQLNGDLKQYFYFMEDTNLPENLYDKSEVVYKLNTVPDCLKLRKTDFNKDLEKQNRIIDLKLTEFERELHSLFKNSKVKLIDGRPGIHTSDWIKASTNMPYQYAVGLVLDR